MRGGVLCVRRGRVLVPRGVAEEGAGLSRPGSAAPPARPARRWVEEIAPQRPEGFVTFLYSWLYPKGLGKKSHVIIPWDRTESLSDAVDEKRRHRMIFGGVWAPGALGQGRGARAQGEAGRRVPLVGRRRHTRT